MTLDVSLEAIEADLVIADRGGQVATIALARAQVRATLLAGQPADHQGRHEAPTVTGAYVGAGGPDIQVTQGADVDVFTVPKSAPWEDRVTAAAMLLGVPKDAFRQLMDDDHSPERVLIVGAPSEDDARAAEPDPYTGEPDEEDVFAEARQARRKK